MALARLASSTFNLPALHQFAPEFVPACSIARAQTYNDMGRVTKIQDGPTGSPTYVLSLGYTRNGMVNSYNDSVAGNWSYTYDAFDRLASSTCTLNCPGSGNSEAYSYSYDQFGNRWKQHLTAGTGYEVDYTFDTNNPSTSHNRNTTSGFAYDAAGDLTSDGTCTPCWTYGYSGQLLSGNGATYTYDGLGHRVQTIYGGYTHDFTLGLGGTPDVEYSGSSYVGSSGQEFFTYRNNTTYFHKTDHLSTPRVSTDYTGTEQRTESNLPFGDNFSEAASPFVDYTGFAGGVWDISNASNTDHFGARDYAKTQGRWLTPDPAGLAAVDITNPQTWNRYAYVTNNPTSFADPSGLVATIPGSFGGGGFIGLYMQTGGSAYNTQMTNYINGQIASGNVVNCGGQCDPGNPNGVGQPGMDNHIYGYTQAPDAITLLPGSVGVTINGSSTQAPITDVIVSGTLGDWGYGAIGTIDDNGFLVPDPAENNSDPPCKLGKCTYTIYTKPHYPPGNACVGGHKANGQPATFVSIWDCIGNISNCQQNQGFYQDSCRDAGNTPMQCTYSCNFQAGGCSYTCQCCNYQ
jgi:RHS repeat-associated protein